MFIRLLILFTIIPVVELYVLLQIGGMIGPLWTILLIIATGIAGAYLARTQGFELLRKIQEELANGHLPAEQLLDGAMVLAGGLLLLTPGFCTDLFGFSILAPFSRAGIKRFIRTWFQHLIDKGAIHIYRP